MVKLFFYGSEQSNTSKTRMSIEGTKTMKIEIKLFDTQNQKSVSIVLDRPTAIRLHRELKKQIANAAPPSDMDVWNKLNKIS
jgi:hypothetical protein